MTKHLKEARHLLRKRGWATKALARTNDGTPISPFDARACSFCAIGAIMAVKGGGAWSAFEYEIELMTSVLGVPVLSQWNDTSTRTKNDVLRAFDLAIRESSRQESTAALLPIDTCARAA